MASTGEVACFGRDKYEAYLKSLLATGMKLPTKSVLFSLGSYKEKMEILPSIQKLQRAGFLIYATAGTSDFLQVRSCCCLPHTLSSLFADVDIF